MTQGQWEYIGVSEVPPDDEDYDWTQERYLVEAHRPLPDDVSGMPRVVRLIVLAVRIEDSPEPLDALRITVDAGVLMQSSVALDSGDRVDETMVLTTEFIPMDSELLRSVPFRRLFSQAVHDLVSPPAGQLSLDVELSSAVLPDFTELRKEWPKGDTGKVSRWAGYVYSRAVSEGEAATKAVEDAFGVSRSTAKRMVSRARADGHIADDVVGAPGPSRTRKGHDNEQGTS